MFEAPFEPAPGCGGGPGDLIVQASAMRLVSKFGLRACWFELFPFDAQLPRIEPGRIVLPATEPGIAPWSIGAGVELPVRYAGLTLGRFVLLPAAPTTGVSFSPSGRAEAISIADRVGTVIAATHFGETSERSSRRRRTSARHLRKASRRAERAASDNTND